MIVEMLARYSRNGASSRLRFLQYQPSFSRSGVQSEFSPLFGPNYLEALYSGRSRVVTTMQAYAARAASLASSSRTDGLWIQSETLPWLPWFIEKGLLPSSKSRVIDCDDAIFHRYDLHGSGLVRSLLGNKIDRLMASSQLVTAGNAYLAERAEAAGAPRIEIVPTVLDLDRYMIKKPADNDEDPVIGWIGSPSTWREYMLPLLPTLTAVAGQENCQIHAIGAEPLRHPLLNVIPWSEDSEAEQILQMDIGIMPLNDTPWSRGKCGYKLIQYMACGLPVIASPVGVNTEIVEEGVNGFLASSAAEWRDAIVTLVRDPDLRQRMGAAGRRKVERQFSLAVWGPRVAQYLQKAAK